MSAKSSHYTVTEAAEILGVTPVTLRVYIRKGLLPGAEKVRGTQWQIPRAAIDFFDSQSVAGAFSKKPGTKGVRESAIESKSVKYAKSQGFEAYKLTGRSDPDRLFVTSDRDWSPRTMAFFVEFKSPGKKPKPHQEREHGRLRAKGFKVYVIDSFDDFAAIIRRIANEI